MIRGGKMTEKEREDGPRFTQTELEMLVSQFLEAWLEWYVLGQ